MINFEAYSDRYMTGSEEFMYLYIEIYIEMHFNRQYEYKLKISSQNYHKTYQ